MIDPIQELKTRAEILEARASRGDARALERLRALAEFKKMSSDDLARAAPSLARKHWLAVVAREAGFKGWEHATRVLSGDPNEQDLGRTLNQHGGAAYLNVWCTSYDEAHAVRAESGGYLLAFDKQFFVAPRGFIEGIGLDPDDDDWRAIGFDWARPTSLAARARLYAKLIERLPRADA